MLLIASLMSIGRSPLLLFVPLLVLVLLILVDIFALPGAVVVVVYGCARIF